jgi:nuclear GTP-binding protein
LRKDPGVPRLPDLKLKVEKAQKKAMVRTNIFFLFLLSLCLYRTLLQMQSKHGDLDSPMASEPTLSTLAMQAAMSSSGHLDVEDPSSSTSVLQKTKEQIRKHYLRALHKVVDESDIVILVLDARDPEGCRSRLVEEEVRRRESEGKKLVFVMNKIGN